MHIKPGELENTLLARELEELPEPRAVDWSQALGLTTLDPGFFFSCAPVISFHQMLFWHHVFCHFVLFGVFLRVGKKKHLALLCPVQRTAASFPCPPVCLPFPLPSLFLQLLPYLCENGVAVKAERRYWSLQLSSSGSGRWLFSKAVLKNPALWKYNSLCRCSQLPMFFHCGFICSWFLSFFHGEGSLLWYFWQQLTFESSSANQEFKTIQFQLLFGIINI